MELSAFLGGANSVQNDTFQNDDQGPFSAPPQKKPGPTLCRCPNPASCSWHRVLWSRSQTASRSHSLSAPPPSAGSRRKGESWEGERKAGGGISDSVVFFLIRLAQSPTMKNTKKKVTKESRENREAADCQGASSRKTKCWRHRGCRGGRSRREHGEGGRRCSRGGGRQSPRGTSNRGTKREIRSPPLATAEPVSGTPRAGESLASNSLQTHLRSPAVTRGWFLFPPLLSDSKLSFWELSSSPATGCSWAVRDALAPAESRQKMLSEGEKTY